MKACGALDALGPWVILFNRSLFFVLGLILGALRLRSIVFLALVLSRGHFFLADWELLQAEGVIFSYRIVLD
jgi:hypothetical protein